MRKKYSDEFLIKMLKEYAHHLKRTPTYQEYERDSTVPSAATYKKRFGSWNNALEMAGLEKNAIRKYSREDIINDALEFYKTNSRSPFYYELGYSTTIIRNYWSGWKAFLIEIGLPLNLTYNECTSRENLIIFLQNLYKRLGKVPSTTDAEKAGVGRHLFLTKFGSFKKALIESKIVNENYFMTVKEKIPESLYAIKCFYNENNKPPTINEYECMVKKYNIAERRALEQSLGMRFTEICFKTIGKANQFKRSKKQLLNELVMLKHQLGRTPMANELIIHGLAEKKQYYRTFRMTYTELVEQLGWKLSTPKKNYKTEEVLLSDYKKLYDGLGRLPFFYDIDNADWMASSSTYKKYFGDLSIIWKTLGVEVSEAIPNKYYGVGYTCIDKNNNICRSVSEMIISNILIDLNISFIKEYLYNKCLPNIKNRYRFDWFLTDYNIGIEYFGLFSEEAIDMNNFIGRYSREVLKKIELCDSNEFILIDLYSEDMDHIEEILLKHLESNGINLEF